LLHNLSLTDDTDFHRIFLRESVKSVRNKINPIKREVSQNLTLSP
jgi:hypothetical protein